LPAVRVKGRIAREGPKVRKPLATAFAVLLLQELATAGRHHAFTIDTVDVAPHISRKQARERRASLVSGT